ncbi:hypothetical protein LTR62_007368 [Meristemomyces frigidus]|uniref:Uncharacterized protein n=1 Tax=Meristemomyces frigidus TaxID=1508187 RepID=A0AAN7TNF5_9PEZI|nr:hypothetical protein LTR62_007368 [Meristemomyces frigidus]
MKQVFITFTALAATLAHANLAARDETFNLNVWNNCKFVKEVVVYTVLQPAWEMVEVSTPTNIQPGAELTIPVPFHGTGMRLSGHAEWGVAGGWRPQALFEFGYSSYSGAEGTAYDLSLMQGSDPDIGMGVWPIENGHGSGQCKQDVCFPWSCGANGNQGWLNPDQSDVGDAAPDTVCYKGKTDFKIVYCP